MKPGHDRMPSLTDGACTRNETSLIFRDITTENFPAARQICHTCPARTFTDCAMWALHHEDSGVWAGMGKDALRAERARRGIKLERISEGEIAPRAKTKKETTP
jgi:hypothetical protein